LHAAMWRCGPGFYYTRCTSAQCRAECIGRAAGHVAYGEMTSLLSRHPERCQSMHDQQRVLLAQSQHPTPSCRMLAAPVQSRAGPGNSRPAGGLQSPPSNSVEADTAAGIVLGQARQGVHQLPPPYRSWLISKSVSGPIRTRRPGFDSCHPPSTRRAFFPPPWPESEVRLFVFQVFHRLHSWRIRARP
jgi:hypothetical protein